VLALCSRVTGEESGPESAKQKLTNDGP